MDFTSNAWYVQYYHWALGVWASYRGNHTVFRDFKNRTTLCHFMRVGLVYAPFIILQHIFVILTALSLITWLPVYLFGASQFGGFMLVLVCFLGGLAALLATFFYGIEGLVKVNNKIEEWTEEKVKSDDPPFFVVAWRYVKALKGRYCPIITIKENA